MSRNEHRMPDEGYQVFPVGEVVSREKRAVVRIAPDYSAALKNLELFSHAIVFFRLGEGTELGRPGILGNRGVGTAVARILRADTKNGIVELDHLPAPDGTPIFDIKPYFPCEDRVKDVRVPAHIGGWSDWREDSVSAAGDAAGVLDGQVIAETIPAPDHGYMIDEIGRFRKGEDGCLVQLSSVDSDLLKLVNEFSHVKVLWWFDRFDKSRYRRITECDPPYENAPRTGVFASRSPVRPNPIAVTTAKIVHVDLEKKQIRLSDLDAFDKTPVIGVIPYIPQLDRVKDVRVPEWLKHWPHWLDDREAKAGSGTLIVRESDVERIGRFVAAGKPDVTAAGSLKEDNRGTGPYSDEIRVRGARQNNLRNIDVAIPKNKMTVITGVSGSGKSSLAFDTIYAESQRRFMDTMFSSGKIALERMEKPEFDEITGLPPAVAIEQKSVGRNPRSTVGTMTDIYDYLRLLFAKIGTRHCPECGRAITPMKEDEITGLLARLVPDTAFGIMAFGEDEPLERFVVPDRQNRAAGSYDRKLKECVRRGLSMGNGAIIVAVDGADEFIFQTKEMCYHCNKIFFELTTSLFSFNNPESMCPACKGLGVKLDVDVDLVVSDPNLSILDGATRWWGDLRKFQQNPNANWMKGEILALAESLGVDLEAPWKELPDSFKRQALYGSNGREVKFAYKNANGRSGEIVRPVEGAVSTILRLFRESGGDVASRISAEFMREKVCGECHGERLAAEGRLVSVAGKRFPETVVMTIAELGKWISDLPSRLTKDQSAVAIPLLRELNGRLGNLNEVGVSYLTLDRTVPTLSGGELQRLRLAAQLSGGITNILYVIDEPSTGLHQKDHRRMIKTMQSIRDEGNTVLVVEHDADTMLAADKIIDIGPGAGIHGGLVVAEGSPQEITRNPNSQTGRYLAGVIAMNPSSGGRKKPYGWIRVIGAGCNNLKHVDAAFPLGVLTCVTGVSGSGKSSLVIKTLYPALDRLLGNGAGIPGHHERIDGAENINKIISVSQQPIGRTPRSNPATYTGVFDHIRDLFASTEDARKRGYTQSRFSFNSKDGQCGACGGEGRKCVEMHFMPDVWVECSVCHGKRFNAETLEIKYNGKSISDVLDMNIEDALGFFADSKKITSILQTLYDVGLGYITLGQSALTFSGGEAQRIKLAKELSRADTGKTMYLLDEPTTGLHFSDIQNLLGILRRITHAGNTVIVIEHNPEVIRNSDWVIDLGPDGGDAGGYIVAQGTPEEIVLSENSYTGKMLKETMVVY